MKTVLNTLFVGMFLITAFSCDNSIVDPPEDQPGRRDYVWTVDTINYPGKTLYRIWGSSPTDIWAVSAGGDITKDIHHFDGTRWATGQYMIPRSPYSIYGFSED